MKFTLQLMVMLLLCAEARAAGPVLTFEGLQNFEPVASYYDGGLGGLGSGPGPDFGITFSQYALAYIHGEQSGHINPFPGDPSPDTVLLVFNSGNPYNAGYPTSITMNVAAGFTGELDFYYIAIGRTASVTLYDGPDGSGTILTEQALPITPEAFASSPTVIDFSGSAESVVFTGGNDQLAFDNISFVPEPSGWLSLVVGLGLGLVARLSSRWPTSSAPRETA